jgi:hypothetical protein
MMNVRESISSPLVGLLGWAAERLNDGLEIAARFKRSLRIITWLLLALLGVSLVLDSGAWTRQETFQGPFRVVNTAAGLYGVAIGAGVPFWLSLRLVGAEPSGHEQNPRLTVDGRAVDMLDTPRPEFVRGLSIDFGLAPRELRFPLPPSVANDERVELSVTYAAQLHSSFHDVVLWSLQAVLLLSFGQIWRTSNAARTERVAKVVPWAGRLGSAVPVLFPAVSYTFIACCTAYALSIGYGLLAGYALPTATAFDLAPAWLAAVIEPGLPLAIFGFAALGAVYSWAASLGVIASNPFWHMQASLTRVWGWCGLPVIVCLFLFSLSAGGWSGHVRPYDQNSNYLSLAGLAAHSDARDYFTDTYQQAIWGSWNVLGSRRPLGEAFRQIVVLLAQYSYVGTLVVQVALVAVTLFLAARTMTRWFGIWAGMALVSLIYIQTRSFLPTTMTEPLALICTLFSIVFLLDALQLKSLPHALVALTGLTAALMTRMGNMFLIPFMAIWIVVYFAPAPRSRLRVFVLASGVVIAVLAVNFLLAWLYASPKAATGSNFPLTLCGLSVGADWSDCARLYASELGQLADERGQAIFLLGKSWDNFQQHPMVLLTKVASNCWGFFKHLPRFMFEGYGGALYRLSAASAEFVVLVLVAGVVHAHRGPGGSCARAFWIILFVSTAMAAAIILSDDGWRALHVTNALMACFFAVGFVAPVSSARAEGAASWRWQNGAAIFAGAFTLCLVVPMASHAWAVREIAMHPAIVALRSDEHVVPGGRFISGFVVVPDGTSRPLAVPSLFASDFVEMIRQINLEHDVGPFLQPVMKRLPFAFIVTGSLDEEYQSHIYIAPPLVLERRDVWAWRFKLRPLPFSATPWVTLRDAATAEPLP